MRKIHWFHAIAAVCLFAASCSSDDKGGEAVEPVFPEKQVVGVTPGGEDLTLMFETNMDWILTSDRQWLKFVTEDFGEAQALSGKAGRCTITVRTTDGNLSFEDDTASATLSMGGVRQTIFTFERAGKERKAHMYTKDGIGNDAPTVEIENIELPYEARSYYAGFSANFDWRIVSAPEWILKNSTRDIRELAGRGGSAVPERSDMAIIEVNPDALYTDLSGEIVLAASAEGVDFSRSFAVTAAGIPAGTVKWSVTPTLRSSGFRFSAGGKWKKPSGMSDYEEVDDPAPLQVLTRDHDYELRCMAWNKEGGIPEEVNPLWLDTTDDDRGSLTFRAQPNSGEERELGMFVIPAGVEVDYGSYFNQRTGAFIGGDFAMKMLQAGADRCAVWKYNTELAAAVPASEESLALVHACGIATDNVFERAFTSEEWSYDPNTAGYAQTIFITFSNPDFDMGQTYFYDETHTLLPFGSFNDWGNVSMANKNGLQAITFAGENKLYDRVRDRKLVIVFPDSKGNAIGACVVLMK